MNDHLEDRLRAELNRHAERAPAGTLLAERIIAAARTQPRPETRRGWPTWTMPLLAAGAVAAIVTGVFVGVSAIRDTASPTLPLVSQPGTSAPTDPAPSPSPSHTAPTSTATVANPPPDNPVGLNNFTATDLTFFGTEEGWALGTADCLVGPGTCPAMVRTTDGGLSWKSMPQPPNGATGVRFATPEIGYAYADSVLEMTTNGGQSWTRQSGGAIALETLNGNVVRLTANPVTGCPGPCNVRAEYAAVGSSNWTASDLGPLTTAGVQLVRSDADVYVLATGNPAKGTPAGTLYASTDNGATWADRGAPCQSSGSPGVVTFAVAAAPRGAVVAGCLAPQGGSASFRLSSDAGTSFAATAGRVPGQAMQTVVGDPSTVLVAAGIGAYRSTDGGASWIRIPEISGEVTFAGFESKTLGRIATNGGRTIWTTTDGGASWSAFTFAS